ncbi:MAG: VWA domain-containing protein [Selenomonadaceae bacterium]|nr:VWA domain-containing protein [Selenomonadaceae bacterium]
MKNLTEVVFILDRSGSMGGLEDDTIGGFNSTLESQKKVEGEVLISTILFDHESIVLHDRVPLKEVKPLTREDYQVRGTTALLDAIGDAVKHIKNVHKYAREEDRPAKTLFVITTDGMENASRKFSYRNIKKLIEEQQGKGWEFLFLGANIDSVEVAGRMGIHANRAVNYHNDKLGTELKYRAVGGFISALAAAPISAVIGDAWREEVDKDFEERKSDGK